jgi:uncharacterized membrane protein YczE
VNPVARAARLLAGVALGALAFSLVLRAHLGLGPWHVVQQGLSRHAPISIGHAAWVVAGGVLLAAVLADARPGPGTVVTVLLGGQAIDLILPHVGTPSGLAARLLTLAVGTAVMAFSAALIISAGVGASPLDSLMTGLHQRLPVPLFAVRVGMEVVGLALGWWAGGEVGIGCVVVGLGIGPGIHFFLDRLDAMPVKVAVAPA